MNSIPQKRLSVFDSVCILAGIIIGAGIYETSPAVASCMGSAATMLGIWLAGGLLALFGSLCYGELATAYPHSGGDVVYLSRAYGRWAGFMFGWSQMMIIRPGDIAMMAFIFARYASQIYAFKASIPIYAIIIILILTILNIIGVQQGKWTQNILTVIKAIGLLAIFAAAVFAPKTRSVYQPEPVSMSGFQLALILVLFTFGGWNEIGYVAAEVKNPRRNIIRSLVLGVTVVTGLYLLTNVAFLMTLGYEGMAGSEAVAVDALEKVLPSQAGRIISVLICLSSLGAVNGLIFTGARISYAVGSEHRLFAKLGKWNPSSGTPVWALIMQGVISGVIVLLAGSFMNTILYTAPLVWLFFLATGCSVLVLRKKEPDIERPFSAGRIPVIPIIFCLTCLFMLYSCFTYAYSNRPAGLIVLGCLLVTGGAVYFVSSSRVKGTNRTGIFLSLLILPWLSLVTSIRYCI